VKRKRQKEGHYIGLGIAIGMPLSIPVGFLLGYIAIAPAIGFSLGMVIGTILEKKLNPDPIKLTAKEKRNRTIALWSTAIVGFIVLVIFVEYYLSLKN
jgi:hypothetical protein